MPLWNPDTYIKAWNFASRVHGDQRVPGNGAPYINHTGLVAMEVLAALPHANNLESPDLAIQCALLHDTIEDTPCSYDDILVEFGKPVADGVLALSKNTRISSKTAQMRDSLERIKEQPREVWIVKLADRITNLQPPPSHWSREKMTRYQQEARKILEQLGPASCYLARRLEKKIDDYNLFLAAESPE